MNSIEFLKTEADQYPELFDLLINLLPTLNVDQTAKLGVALGMLMPSYLEGGQDAYLMKMVQITQTHIDQTTDHARTFGDIAKVVEDHVLRNLGNDG